MSKAFWRGFWEGANVLFWLAWALYGLGHLVSLTMNWRGFDRLYPVYNWLMCKSLAVQERYGFSSPWGVTSK